MSILRDTTVNVVQEDNDDDVNNILSGQANKVNDTNIEVLDSTILNNANVTNTTIMKVHS